MKSTISDDRRERENKLMSFGVNSKRDATGVACISPPLLPRLTSRQLSLDHLNDDVVHHILAFVPDIKEIARFAFTSKRALSLVFQSQVADGMFEVLYRKSFAYDGPFLNGGREQWKSLRRLRDSLEWGMLFKQESKRDDSPPSTLGIVSPSEEAEAILYDNPSYSADQPQVFIGYFGFHSLKNNGPVLVWGDFNGVRVAPSISDLLADKLQYQQKTGKKSPVKTKRRIEDFYKAVGHQDGGFQVLAVLESPNCYEDVSFFLGFASGMVMGVSVRSLGEGEYEYITTSTASVHTSEVTTLATLPSNSRSLLSGSVDGKVFVYPASMRGSLDNAYVVVATPSAIFSISAAKWEAASMLICTGDSEGKVAMWHTTGAEQQETDEHLNVSLCHIYSSTCSDEDSVLVTQVLFLHDDCKVFFSGTNAGEIRLWDVEKVEKKLGTGEIVWKPQLTLKHAIGMAHRGTIETIKAVGNIILTSGGNDGQTKGWDMHTGEFIGSLAVHPGRMHSMNAHGKQKRLKSAVVETLVCHDRESLVSLCRDGTLQDWSFAAEAHHRRKEAVEKLLKRRGQKRKRSLSSRPWEQLISRENMIFSNAAAAIEEQRKQMLDELGLLFCDSGLDCQSKKGDSELDSALRLQMKKYIIYAAFRHSCEVARETEAPCPFLGANNRIYADVRTAFDRFSGIHPCKDCKASGNTPYVCRLCRKHDDGVESENTESSMFLQCLMRSTKIAPKEGTDMARGAASPKDVSDCAVEETGMDKDVDDESGQESVSLHFADTETFPSTSMDSGDSMDETCTLTRVWKCYKCNFANPWRKYRCLSCGGRVGGVSHFVKLEDADFTLPHQDSEISEGLSNEGSQTNNVANSAATLSVLNSCLVTENIKAPHSNDVLFGMKKECQSHDGNQRFRALIEHQKIYYRDATSSEGSFISRGIVRAIRSQIPPGRFLMRDESRGVWSDVGDAAAELKASKSLWEVRRKGKKKTDRWLQSV